MSTVKVFLCRHGETTWSKSGQHTSTTDLALTEQGVVEAGQLKLKLDPIPFDHVFTSPLKRAKETCEICLGRGEVDPDLVEWSYGDYEGITTPAIHNLVPDWNVFTHGAPNGESVDQMVTRTSRVVSKLQALKGNVAIFSHGHFLRALATRWIGQQMKLGRHLDLGTATLSCLTFNRAIPVISCWNL